MGDDNIWTLYLLLMGINTICTLGGLFMGWLLWGRKRKRF